jgi:hypothetical protein
MIWRGGINIQTTPAKDFISGNQLPTGGFAELPGISRIPYPNNYV